MSNLIYLKDYQKERICYPNTVILEIETDLNPKSFELEQHGLILQNKNTSIALIKINEKTSLWQIFKFYIYCFFAQIKIRF